VTLDEGPLSHGDWWGHSTPFRHWRATDVLDATAYDRVSAAFEAVLETTAGKRDGRYRLVQSAANYDARMLAIDDDLRAAFDPFFSDAWIAGLERFLSIPSLGRVDGALHSSPRGSRSGWIHNDLCSAWFHEESPPAGGIVFADRRQCDYFTGRPKQASANPTEYVRAAALIYYLCNDAWKPGGGGETALYSASRQDPTTRCELVAPVNNTLLLFECSPHSHHRFVQNPGCVRNSIIFWLHVDVAFAQSRWGQAVNRRSSG
jgi:hypothetical protein